MIALERAPRHPAIRFASSLGLMPNGHPADIGGQLLGGVGRLTSAVGSVIGAVASVIVMN